MTTHSLEQYEVLIIGGGQGGALGRMLAQAGRKVALVEKFHVGGTCVNVGCTPTKTLAYGARIAYLARRSADYGVHTGPVSIDWPAMRRRKVAVVDDFRQGVEQSLGKVENLDLIYGSATFCGPQRVAVQLNEGGSRKLEAPIVVLATGTRPQVPPLDGLEQVPYLDSTSLMEMEELPRHLLILGGGYIAVEFGQMFRRFGAQVTIVQAGAQLLGREDPDIAEAMLKILREDGLDIHLHSKAQGVRQVNGEIELTIQTPQGQNTLRGSHLLVATGRTPNSDTLNLEAAGVPTDAKGFIRVNDKLETDVPGIYALGDAKGGPAFTHIAYDDARILHANLCGGKNATTQHRWVPYTVFTDPQLGRIGMSEQQAREAGFKIRIATLTLDQTARGWETSETRGLWKVIVDEATDQILGGAFLSIEGGEIATVLQVAMMGRLPYTALRDGTFSHPTLSESLNNLFLALDRQRRQGCEA